MCKFIQMYSNQCEESIELIRKIVDDKSNLELNVKQWNEKLCDMIINIEALTLETIEVIKKLKCDEINTDELVSHVENICREGITILKLFKCE